MMKTLDVQDISFGYFEKVPVLENLSIGFRTGEAVCILGANGSGKSTFLSCILNYLHPSEGKILLDGENIRGIDTEEYARYVSLIPQSYDISFPYRVLDLVLMGRTPHFGRFSTPQQEDYDATLEALRSLGIEDLIYRPCTQLSGGQLQLVMLARALAQQADFILLDEPTSHLDYGNQIRTLKAVLRMKENGVGVIMTSHFPDHAFMGCDRVAIMKGGKFVAVGTPDEVLTEENLRSVYGIPVKICEVDCNGKRKICVPYDDA